MMYKCFIELLSMHVSLNLKITLLPYMVLFHVQGVCIGLSEVLGSAGKHQLVTYMSSLIPTIRDALCDRYSLFTLLVFLSLLISCRDCRLYAALKML